MFRQRLCQISSPIRFPAETAKQRSAANGKDGGTSLAQRLRSVPIQCSIDIAVPLQVAYEQWMELEFLPEAIHTVRRIRRDGDRLRGHIAGAARERSRWRAEIREERTEESFAWLPDDRRGEIAVGDLRL